MPCSESTETVGDGSIWSATRDTIQPDITAYELACIMKLGIYIADGHMTGLKASPRLLRHFIRTAPPIVEKETPDAGL